MRTPTRLPLILCLLAGSVVADANAGDCTTCATKTVGSTKTVDGSKTVDSAKTVGPGKSDGDADDRDRFYSFAECFGRRASSWGVATTERCCAYFPDEAICAVFKPRPPPSSSLTLPPLGFGDDEVRVPPLDFGSGAVFVLPPPPTSGGSCSMTWSLDNRTRRVLNVEFESETGEWPEPGYTWRMAPGRHDFPLGCECGEWVEYGAWDPDTGLYWGSGRDNAMPCDDCAARCVNNRVGIGLTME